MIFIFIDIIIIFNGKALRMFMYVSHMALVSFSHSSVTILLSRATWDTSRGRHQGGGRERIRRMGDKE